jgi:succinylarginine dihydrolase
MKKNAQEWQVDGLVGPTHNYAGLAFGNVASQKNMFSVSNPRLAALQGIAKMREVIHRGGKQAFFMPHYRPVISELKRIGFVGTPPQVIERVFREAPELLASVYSASAMWAANAATVSPSSDSGDGKVHFTPANLIGNFHRSVESGFTTRLLRRMFSDARYFTVHDPLPSTTRFADEGAANHMRIAASHGEPGVHVFVYGTPRDSKEGGTAPTRFPARQYEEASRAIARLHQLDPDKCLFIQQNPDAIEAGVFHHDVIGLNARLFLAQHEMAWCDSARHLARLRQLLGDSLKIQEISPSELPLADAVSSYLFNSQLLSDGEAITILAPGECADHPCARAIFDRWLADDAVPVAEVKYLDVRESMKNGGGPACLRLRVVLTEEEAAAMHSGVVVTPEKASALEAWVTRYYRDQMALEDLRDPLLVREVEEALDALSVIVGMPNLYPFQE